MTVLHLGTWLISLLSYWGWLNDVARHAPLLKRMSEWFYRFGSTVGGMHVELRGIDHQLQPLMKSWYLIAKDGDGPQVPCTAAVILARKFFNQQFSKTGAYACMGFIDKDEFDKEFEKFAIQQHQCEKSQNVSQLVTANADVVECP